MGKEGNTSFYYSERKRIFIGKNKSLKIQGSLITVPDLAMALE